MVNSETFDVIETMVHQAIAKELRRELTDELRVELRQPTTTFESIGMSSLDAYSFLDDMESTFDVPLRDYFNDRSSVAGCVEDLAAMVRRANETASTYRQLLQRRQDGGRSI